MGLHSHLDATIRAESLPQLSIFCCTLIKLANLQETCLHGITICKRLNPCYPWCIKAWGLVQPDALVQASHLQGLVQGAQDLQGSSSPS